MTVVSDKGKAVRGSSHPATSPQPQVADDNPPSTVGVSCFSNCTTQSGVAKRSVDSNHFRTVAGSTISYSSWSSSALKSTLD